MVSILRYFNELRQWSVVSTTDILNLVDTRTQAVAANLTGANFVQTVGYRTVGDYGGALYKKAGGLTTGGFQSADGQWWALAEPVPVPQMFGAFGDGTSNDTASVQNAINFVGTLSPSGVGAVYFPPSYYNVQDGLTVSGSGVRLFGSGVNGTILWDNGANVATPITITNSRVLVENMSIWGCGRIGYTDPIPTFPTMVVSSGDAVRVKECQVQFGNVNLQVSTQDVSVSNTAFGVSYGGAMINVLSGGQVWLDRCQLDNNWPVSAPSYGVPIPSNWVALTAYTSGQLVVNGTFILQCLTSGTSGASNPVNKAWGQNINDGTVVWRIACQVNFSGILFQPGSGENYINRCDFSALGYYAVRVVGGAVISVTDSVMGLQLVSGIIQSSNASQMFVTNSEVGGGLATGSGILLNTGYTGKCTITGCDFFGGNRNIDIVACGSAIITGNDFNSVVGSGVVVENGVNNVIVNGNFFDPANVTNAVNVLGANDYYLVVNNIGHGATFVDGGGGAHKTFGPNW